MAEEVRVNRQIERGFVDTGRPGPTGLDSLGKALGRFGQFVGEAADFGARQAVLEERRVVEILDNPAITPEEIQTIEEESTFPLAKLKARNRQGQALVEQMRPKIEDRLDKAGDVVEAREALREIQADLMDGVDDPGVLAGIREHMASIAAPLLSESVKRRRVARDEQERQNRAFILDSAARDVVPNPDAFIAQAENQILDESIVGDPTMVASMHDDIIGALVNEYSRNPAAAGPILGVINRLDSGEVKGFFGTRSTENRLKYSRLRDAIRRDLSTIESARLTERQIEEIRSGPQHIARQWIEQNPERRVLPPQIMEELETAYAGSDPTELSQWVTEAFGEFGRETVFATQPYKQARTNLKNSFKASEGMLLENGQANPNFAFGAPSTDYVRQARVLQTFDTLAEGLDPSVLEETDGGRSVLNALADKARVLTDEAEKARAEISQEFLVMKERRLEEAIDAGDITRAEELERNLFKIEQVTAQQRLVDQALYEAAENMGFNILDDLLVQPE